MKTQKGKEKEITWKINKEKKGDHKENNEILFEENSTLKVIKTYPTMIYQGKMKRKRKTKRKIQTKQVKYKEKSM
jgi:hypothetical protein